MRKKDLARKLSIATGVSRGEAADQVDRLVNELLQKLRDGQTAKLDGIGLFRKNAAGEIELLKEQG
jgi:nucleoid DNA-binding protein